MADGQRVTFIPSAGQVATAQQGVTIPFLATGTMSSSNGAAWIIWRGTNPSSAVGFDVEVYDAFEHQVNATGQQILNCSRMPTGSASDVTDAIHAIWNNGMIRNAGCSEQSYSQALANYTGKGTPLLSVVRQSKAMKTEGIMGTPAIERMSLYMEDAARLIASSSDEKEQAEMRLMLDDTVLACKDVKPTQPRSFTIIPLPSRRERLLKRLEVSTRPTIVRQKKQRFDPVNLVRYHCSSCDEDSKSDSDSDHESAVVVSDPQAANLPITDLSTVANLTGLYDDACKAIARTATLSGEAKAHHMIDQFANLRKLLDEAATKHAASEPAAPPLSGNTVATPNRVGLFPLVAPFNK